MARRKQGNGRTTPKGTRSMHSSRREPPAVADPYRFDAQGGDLAPLPAEDMELFDAIQSVIEGHPMELLDLASAFVDSVDPRAASFADPMAESDPDIVVEDLLQMAGLRARETDALAMAIAALLPDPTALATVTAHIGSTDRLPLWLQRIDEVRISHVSEVVHVLRDADQYAIEAVFADGQALTVAVLIDNNAGVVVTDGFATPIGHEQFAELVAAQADPNTTQRPVDPGVARARLVEAIELGFDTHPHDTTETWPDSRPLVEWLLRCMPDAPAVDIDRPEPLSRAESTAIATSFLASPHAAELSDAARGLVDHVLWFKGGHGMFDPLRWSAASVAMFLGQWVPRTLDVPAEELAEMPAVLRAFIRFGHERLGIPEPLTEETISAVWDLRERDGG